MKSSLFLSAAVSVCLLASTATAEPRRIDAGQGARIVNGTVTSGFPTAGVLLSGSNPGTAELACSGTLIGCETFLTAAHCVCNGDGPDCQSPNDPDANAYLVFLQNAGFFTIDDIIVHPDYDFPRADLAVVKLAVATEGIYPTPLNQTQPTVPMSGTIAGFGRTGGGIVNADFGVKRFGPVTTTDCNVLTNDELICWNFDGPESNTCNGDSGGPLFMDFGAGDVLAGATSGGASSTCLATDHSYDVNIATYYSWIDSVTGADVGAVSCGTGSHVGDADTAVLSASGELGDAPVSALHEFIIVEGSDDLRIAMNAHDDGTADFDMYVKQGAPPTPLDFDCSQSSSGQYGYCRIESPAGGRWYVGLERESGEGTYQVTLTNTGTTASTCGNGIIEPGEGCDGADDNQCPGLCQIDCMCPAPVCGNDIREVGEECDGTDASACTGPCGGDCTCPCPSGLSRILRLVAKTNKLLVSAEFNNDAGTFIHADPRNQFLTILYDGFTLIGIDIPPGSPGWDSSKPEKGKFKWRGELLNGIRTVRIKDRTAKDGTWRVLVKGKQVPNTDQLDVVATNFQFTVDGVCAQTGCGDGIVEGDEECDDFGESGSCDSDCTLAQCGDLRANATAGEQCDPPNGSTCDENCLSIP